MTERRVALVTGVSSGIGRSTVIRLLEAGFRTFGTTRRPKGAGELPASLEWVQLDVRDEESVRACIRLVTELAGRIDALVNNAGAALIGSMEETTIDEARLIFETNFFGVMRMNKAVLPIMRSQGRGRIINLSSVLGFLPAPYMAAYAASKHAIEGYSETLDHEVRQFGIRVSIVEPGFTRTSLGDNGELAAQSVEAYNADRSRVLAAVRQSISKGDDPAIVANTILKALNDSDPRLRYSAGRAATVLSRLRRWGPKKLLDRGLRKQFGLVP